MRCSGGIPCGRCDNRSIGCEYPTARRSKARARKEASQRLSSIREKDSCPQASQASASLGDGNGAQLAQDEPELPSQPPASQMTQFQIQLNAQNTPNASSQKSSNLNFHKPAENQSKGPSIHRKDVDTGDRNSNLLFRPYAEMSAQQTYLDPPTSDVQGTLPSEPATRVSGQRGNAQPGMDDSNVDSEMASGENQQMQLGFDQPLLDTSVLSMNWLPSDLFPDAVGNPPSLPELSLQPNLNQGEPLDGSLPSVPWPPSIINTDHVSPHLPENISQTPSGNTSLGTDVESPGQFSQAVSSQSELHNTTTRTGNYYVDGAGSRLPKYRRRQRLLSRSSAGSADICSQSGNDLNPVVGFPLVQEVEMMSEKNINNQIEPSTYGNIHSNFLQLCCKENFIYQKFETERFPSAASLTNFIQAYFDSFQPVYPIFHSPTFNPNRCHWLATLAVSAIGSHVADIPETEQCAAAFHEFLRRAINVEVRMRLPR